MTEGIRNGLAAVGFFSKNFLRVWLRIQEFRMGWLLQEPPLSKFQELNILTLSRNSSPLVQAIITAAFVDDILSLVRSPTTRSSPRSVQRLFEGITGWACQRHECR